MATPGRRRRDGSRPWRAHWRDDSGALRNRTFETKDAAYAWEARMRQERDDRVLGINTAARNTTLNAWIVEWWDRYKGDWVLNTQEDYERAINSHIAPYIGRLKMVELTTPRLARFRDDLVAAGVAASDVASTLRVLSSCLGKAVERGLLSNGNPCRDLSKPKFGATRQLRWPVSPEEVELLRRELMEYRASNSGPWNGLRSATIVSVMAYAGLRPEEVMGLKLGAYLDAARVLKIEDVFAADHRPGDTKTHQDRVVSLQDAVVEDLRLWIDVLDESHPDAWLFPPSPGHDVTRWTHRNWAGRPWKRAVSAVVSTHPEFAKTLGQATPRTLRASFVSLLARAGRPDAEIADETGHSIQILRRHYLGVIKSLRRLPMLSEDEQIQRARAKIGTSPVAQALRRELLRDAARPRTQVVSVGGPPAREMSP